MSTPAYQYGVLLGNIHRSITEMFEQIAKGMRAATRPTRDLTPEEREVRAELASRFRYQRRIEAERKEGLRFVRDYAAQVRREMGL